MPIWHTDQPHWLHGGVSAPSGYSLSFQRDAGAAAFDPLPLIVARWGPSKALPVRSLNAEDMRMYSAWLELNH